MEPIETIEYRGYEIEIHHDPDAPNPWEDWGGQPPLIACHGRNDNVVYGDVNLDSLPELTRNEIKNNLKAVTDEFEHPYLLAGVRDYIDSSSDAVEAVNTALMDWYDDCNDSDKLEMQSRIYDIKGIANLNTSIHGCVQGAYADVLIVATPEFLKECGIDSYKQEYLKADAELYQNWCYGNVYGFQLLDTNGEAFDSVYGFYGDPDKSGLIDDAKTIVNWTIKGNRQRHFKQVKQWIKGKVPLQYRVS